MDPITHLYDDEEALQSYLDKVLSPMAKALSTHKALAASEIVNEPERLMKSGISDSIKCIDTHKLSVSYISASWVGTGLTMKEILRFINRHSAAIHSAVSRTLVTTGAWKEFSATDVLSDSFNYYKDGCLTAAGGKSNGHLDFYQVFII